MRMRWTLAGLGLFVIAAGCTPMPSVALQATPARPRNTRRASGQGEYESAALGRRGSIEFTLKAGTDDALWRCTDGAAPAAGPLTSHGPIRKEQAAA